MQIKELKTLVFEYSFDELKSQDKLLIEKSREVAKKAYAPYSKFNVGAAILLANDEIICGNNQENAAYPSGICAERTAIFYANANYPDVPVLKVAISVYFKSDFIEMPVPPCGSCRQVLLETENRFNQPIQILMAGKHKIFVIENVKSLLPLTFGNDFLM